MELKAMNKWILAMSLTTCLLVSPSSSSTSSSSSDIIRIIFEYTLRKSKLTDHWNMDTNDGVKFNGNPSRS